jgi:flagellar motor switch protein FliM
MTTITKTDPSTQFQVIDSCLLGRPVHLLHLFAAQFREDLAAAMRLPMSRRYWGGFEVEAVSFDRAGAGAEPCKGRWLSFSAVASRIGFSIERGVLLGVLNHRYGRSASPLPAADPDAGMTDRATEPAPEPKLAASSVRVTATEERLAVLLGQQLSGALTARVRANLAAAGQPVPQAPDPMRVIPGAVPGKGAWIICVDVRDPGDGAQGRLWFALDKPMMADVLHGLLPERKQAGKTLRGARPLASQLHLKLDGRLVSKQVHLGALFELQVGDIIPISLSRTEVMLEESLLFTAAVSEHKGKLCLTSFADAD